HVVPRPLACRLARPGRALGTVIVTASIFLEASCDALQHTGRPWPLQLSGIRPDAIRLSKASFLHTALEHTSRSHAALRVNAENTAGFDVCVAHLFYQLAYCEWWPYSIFPQRRVRKHGANVLVSDGCTPRVFTKRVGLRGPI